MSDQYIYHAADEDGTRVLGKLLAATLPNTALIALNGPLGAGKTRLVQAVAKAVGIDPALVTSPTFVLIHEYTGRAPLFHFDVYRIRDDDEFLSLGPEEYFARPGWTFIEWADRIATCLPRERLEISIEPDQSTARRFLLQAFGPAYQDVLVALRENIDK